MPTAKVTDLLNDPALRSHTERILALQEQERQTRQKLGEIIAAIGAELLAVKEALDKLGAKTAWLRWLKSHVHYSVPTAENYMRVARLAQKIVNVYDFFVLDPSQLYRIAALPDAIVTTLTPDTVLTDPRTGKQLALREMSARTLDRALDALEGKTPPKQPKPDPAVVLISGETREEVAADAQRIIGLLAGQLVEIRKRKGSLTGASKQRVLDSIEGLRSIVLKWPAWAKPTTAPAGRNAR